MRRLHKSVAIVAIAATATLAAACSSGSKSSSSGNTGTTSSSSGGGSAPVTLTWWHNANNDPGKSQFQKVANDYHAAHPNVTIKVQPFQNEDIKTKIPIALQGGNPPSIFQQWGGGSEATQAQSGKLLDITSQTSSWISELGSGAKGWQVDGKQYGVPYDYHVVGFWYRKDLFQQAGISAAPTTMDELNADVAKLKAANIVPIALGGKDKWPDGFWYEYFVVRECSADTVTSSLNNKNLADPCFVKAGEDLKTFLATKPFNSAYLSTSAQQGAGSSAGMVANGKAAMELMGDWEMAVMPALTKDKAFADKLGWFPFPNISGGAGAPNAALGGGDGFSCTAKATDACADFLKYLSSAPVQTTLVQTNTITLPANPAANSAITQPTLKASLSYLQSAPSNQLYFDQALPTAVGNALNDAISNFFAGQGSPEGIAQSVAKAAANQ